MVKWLTIKLLAVSLTLETITAVLLFSLVEYRTFLADREKLVSDLRQIIAIQSGPLELALWEVNTNEVKNIVREIDRLPQIEQVQIRSDDGQLVASAGIEDAQPSRPEFRATRQLIFRNESFTEPVGTLSITVHDRILYNALLQRLRADAFVIAIMMIVLAAGTFTSLSMLIGRPLSRMLSSIEKLKRENLRQQVEWRSSDELGRVIGAYNEMLVSQATAEEELRKAHDEARNRMAELTLMNRRAAAGELSASITHEINQPLAAIATSANAGLRWLSNKTPNVEEAAAAFKRIASDAHRAGQVTETIRTMFKKDIRDRVRVDINELIREVLALLSTEVKRHNISVNSVLAERLPQVLVDRVQLQQVVLNLVMNAIEAMSTVAGRPRVLQLRSDANDLKEAVITIEDSGPGIDPKTLNQIFEPFFTTKKTGMGMGLSICRSIIEAHDGRLTVAPAHPHGSIFQVILPIHSKTP
jgi:C4-dicarboxylate-specific signal transduction histidine kinase